MQGGLKPRSGGVLPVPWSDKAKANAADGRLSKAELGNDTDQTHRLPVLPRFAGDASSNVSTEKGVRLCRPGVAQAGLPWGLGEPLV